MTKKHKKTLRTLRAVPHVRHGVALAFAGSLGMLAMPVLAAPAADSAYATDPQQSWVNDRSAEPIRSVNNIMCHLNAMKPAALVNQGPYAALINSDKCESDGEGSDSSNTGGNFKRVIVDATRTATTEPMRAKAWVPGGDGGQDGPSGDIFVNLSASEAPSDANPNGVFTVDYCAPMPDGSCFMNGRLQGLASGINYVEREGSNTLRMFVARNGSNGSGAVARDVPGNANESLTYQFAYDANYFRRVKQGSNATEDACFDRSLNNGKSSAFRYGLYTEAGARVERNGGFPVTTVVAGKQVQGFAGYFGLSFPGNIQSQITDGATVVKQSFDRNAGTGESYTLTKVSGRLMKFTKQSVPLAKVKNLPINIGLWNGLSNATAAAVRPGATQNTFRGQQAEVSFDPLTLRFVLNSIQDCSAQAPGSNGCSLVRPASPVPLGLADLDLYRAGFQGYSQALGGEVSVPSLLLIALAGGNPSAIANQSVVVRVSELVYPGSASAPTQLFCVNNCTTATGLQELATGQRTHPFGTTQDQFMNAATTVAYTFGADGKLSTAGTPVLWPASLTAQQAGMFGNGVRGGKLLPTQDAFRCANDNTKFCANAADEAEVFYAWETGPNSWNQFAGLRGTDGQYLQFDAPLNVSYNVPDRAEFGQFRGSVVRLQYNGFGDLWGIPSNCVDPATNNPVACGEGTRWVPAFTIPATLDEGVVTDSNGTQYLVKWLNREVRFAKVAGSFCSALTVGSIASLPAATGLNNPAKATDPLYIGAKPEVTGAPRVVDGVVKY